MPYGLAEPQDFDWGEALCDSQSCAFGIDKYTSRLINVLKKSPDLLSKNGSPGTIAKEFGTELCDAYMEHIGRPTTTNSKRSNKGQFYHLVEYAFEIVGLPSEDVAKVVIAACPKRGWNPPKKE